MAPIRRGSIQAIKGNSRINLGKYSPHYSYLNASIGSSLDAFMAG